jgi:hypothetical protein
MSIQVHVLAVLTGNNLQEEALTVSSSMALMAAFLLISMSRSLSKSLSNIAAMFSHASFCWRTATL